MKPRASHLPASALRRNARPLSVRRCLGLLVILLATIAPRAWAQQAGKALDSYFKEVWTTREGLPHNLVHSVAQTPDGYIWFATWEGLARYNGLEFRIFDRGSVPELRDNGIRGMRLGADNTIWLGTSRGGVTRVRDGIWRTFTEADGLAQDEIMDLAEDREGHLWIATESAGVTRLDASGAVSYGRDDGLPSEVMYGIAQDSEGAMWFASSDGVAAFRHGAFHAYGVAQGLPSGQVFSIVATQGGELFVGTERGVYRRQVDRFEPLGENLPRDNVTTLLVDNEGSLWFGTVNSGLFRHSTRGLEQISSRNGLPNDRVSTLFQDREGSLWVGTNAGLLRLRDAPFTTLTTEHGVPDDYVRSVIADSQGALWIGTSRGLGRMLDGRITTLRREDGLPGDSILSLAESRDESLWIGTYSNGVVRWKDGVQQVLDVASGLPGNQIRALLEARDGTLWIGSSRGLTRWRDGQMRRFTMADGMPRDFIIALHEDRKGRIWVGTSNGLARIEGDQVFPRTLEALDDTQDIFGFHETEDGTLWLATDRGLIRLRDDSLQLIGRARGLPVDSVFQIAADSLGNFWVTSNRGILRAARADLDAAADGRLARVPFDSFGEGDGMASAQCNGGSGPVVARTADGRLWFGTAKGLSMTDPRALSKFIRTPPPVVIEELRVDDQAMAPRASMVLPPGTRKLELHFVGLSYLMPQKMRYRYRLEGFDADWIERGTRRFAQFTNLAPGDYVFRVAAANPNGPWSSNEARIALRIEPLLVQRRAFWFAIATLALVGLYALYRLRVYRLESAQDRLRELIDQRTADLRAQTERLTAADRDKTELLQKIQAQSEAFERQAREDSLTGLANRRSFDEALAREFARANRHGHALSIALADLDYFKRLNDSYSHAAGDAALKAVANIMADCCRSMDIVARWGGEEFALLFPQTGRDEARQICERIRARVAELDCSDFAPGHALSISFGIADHVGLSHHEKMISHADLQLYEAKRAGRNRVCG